MTTQRRRRRYPHPKWRVYWSLILALLSVILAVMLLRQVLLLIYYFISMSLLTAIVFILKTRFSFLQETENSQTQGNHATWIALIIAFLMLLGIVLVPLALAWLLHPHIWFILIISFVSGVSFAEVLIYLHTR